jgi:hemerythrin superfamily protein
VNDDVIDLLIAQHDRMERLFVDLLTSVAARAEERAATFDELVRVLAVHEAAEEEVVHPYARAAIADGEQIVDARLEEERLAKDQLASLCAMGVDSPEFELRLLALRDVVAEHARAEERHEFTRLRACVEPATLRAMATAVRTAEALAPDRHDIDPSAKRARLALDPPLAVFDRARDLVRAGLGSAP